MPPPNDRSQGSTPDDRDRLRLAVLDAANVIDVALDSEPVVMTAMLIEVLDRLELVLDQVAA